MCLSVRALLLVISRACADNRADAVDRLLIFVLFFSSLVLLVFFIFGQSGEKINVLFFLEC